MGRHSLRQKGSHKAHLVDLALRLTAAKAVGVPLPGQPVTYTPRPALPGETSTFRTSDGATYAVDRNGSLRRAPDGYRVLEVPRA